MLVTASRKEGHILRSCNFLGESGRYIAPIAMRKQTDLLKRPVLRNQLYGLGKKRDLVGSLLFSQREPSSSSQSIQLIKQADRDLALQTVGYEAHWHRILKDEVSLYCDGNFNP